MAKAKSGEATGRTEREWWLDAYTHACTAHAPDGEWAAWAFKHHLTPAMAARQQNEGGEEWDRYTEGKGDGKA